jgi:hypothetical protein
MSISSEPAKVEPFYLKIDLSKWELSSNHTIPRKMDRTREKECMRQIELMLEKGILQPSRAAFYSHALLVPKANSTWRFVIDFTKLNLATDKEGWPIPNIELMLQRIGEKKPRYFIVLDLTNGYFQIPLAPESRVYTAFLASNKGLFEWLRLPMGLKGAPAFFQRVLSTTVLAGLISIICELYLDDLIIFAKDSEELIERFRIILTRFREFNILINPEKCKMGLEEVTYVGHTINESGIHFSLDFQARQIKRV